jgi:predicted nucleic acid-binding protein
MDRLFLDANVLFSAAYKKSAGLLDLWKLKNVTLCSSRYAVEEAKINLSEQDQRERLMRLAEGLELVDMPIGNLPSGISLPTKDVPIFLAALAANATHLITGDLRHFGPYFGKRIGGILIVSPSDYLKKRI